MGFFVFGDKPESPLSRGYSPEFLHRHQCGVCPLNHVPGNRNPHMEATGSEEPWIYSLGEAPGADEDREGRQFIGESGRLFRAELTQDLIDNMRWNNAVRTRPPKNRTPTETEVECCRPSVAADIERTKPPIIWGMGNVPLHWATRQNGIAKWRGRRLPIRVGEHVCWFFPMLHPAGVLHVRDNPHLYEQQLFLFQLDIRNAIDAMDAGLPEPVVWTREDALADIELITSPDEAINALQTLRDVGGVHGVDLETTRTRPYDENACILSASISSEDGTYAFPLYHRDCAWSQKDTTRVERALVEYLRSPDCAKVCFSPLEMEFLAYFYGWECIDTVWDDAQAQAFLLDGRPGTLSLDFLCLQHFGINIKAINNVDVTRLDETPLDLVLRYNGMDAKFHRLLFLEQETTIIKQSLGDVYNHHMERQRAAVLCQLKGVPVDQDVVSEIHGELHDKREAIGDEIASFEIVSDFKTRTGHPYRPVAPQDASILFGSMLNFPGKVSDEEGLEQVDHPLAKLTVDWRHINKALSTYVLPAMVGSETSCVWPDGLLHQLLQLIRTRTWRTSSAEPNTQNYSKHNEFKKVRKMMRKLGYKCVSFDYGQIQARNVAMESLDEALIQSFWDRTDTHAEWCEQIVRLYPRWIKEGAAKLATDPKLFKWYRQETKNKFVFPTFFGATGKSVAGYLGIPEEIGYKVSEMFLAAFPHVKNWQDKTRDSYHETGYVTGRSEFRRWAPVAWTEIINTPIQSDEVLIVGDAMVRLTRREDERLIPNLMIHDDLTFWWQPQDIDKLAPIVIAEMLDVPFEWAHVVPISVEMSVGDDWFDMEDVGKYESDTWDGKVKKPPPKKRPDIYASDEEIPF